jgi:ribosomal protein S2
MEDRAYLPDLVIFLNPGNYYHAIRECTSRNIPTIGIVDSDIDPRIVTYPIPANMEVSQLSYSSYLPIYPGDYHGAICGSKLS